MTFLLLFLLPPWTVSFDFLFFFLSCSFLLIHFYAWHSSYFSVFLLKLIHFTSMHVMSLRFSSLIAVFLYLISVHATSLTFLSSFLFSFVSFMCMAFLLFFVFPSTAVSFQICAWYLSPHCSYPSPFHFQLFNLFTITYFILCAGCFSYWHFIILLFPYLILIHGISLAFPF